MMTLALTELLGVSPSFISLFLPLLSVWSSQLVKDGGGDEDEDEDVDVGGGGVHRCSQTGMCRG